MSTTFRLIASRFAGRPAPRFDRDKPLKSVKLLSVQRSVLTCQTACVWLLFQVNKAPTSVRLQEPLKTAGSRSRSTMTDAQCLRMIQPSNKPSRSCRQMLQKEHSPSSTTFCSPSTMQPVSESGHRGLLPRRALSRSRRCTCACSGCSCGVELELPSAFCGSRTFTGTFSLELAMPVAR